MVKKVTISDRDYRMLKRTNSSIQKNVNFLETENRNNRYYYDVLWECYCDSLNRINNLKSDLNIVHGRYYDEKCNSQSKTFDYDELHKKYMNLLGNYEMLWCKYDEQQTEGGVKEENEKNVVKPWSGRIL